ncbi:ATP-binding protein [Nocardioides sp. W7]|uniref:PAS domain-containing sensor histidine kinase n=1 Tax=Nocardioides sp. W7 TaxID=2931390 RepID=UPI001FD2B5C2|nr:ATP-binding protein [Nocardioides sp. W7]
MADDLGSLQLQTLLSQTSAGIAATDARGRMTLLSPALQHLFGVQDKPYAEDEIPERFRLYDESGTVPLRPHEVPLVRARAGEVVTDVVVTAQVPERGLIHLRCNGAPLRNQDGIIVGGIVMVEDITSERAALREQAELRRRLIETVNHEFRTPLSTLFGHAELLADAKDRLPADLARSATAALRAAESLSDLVHTVSDLVDLGEAARVVRIATDLRPMLVQVAEEQQAAATTGTRVRVEADEHVRAPVDPDRLRKAIAALVANAVTYAPSDSEVLVRAWTDECHLHVVVIDQGSGIPAADHERLVEPFERGSHPQQAVSSRGLGLAVAHTVALAHGGVLELANADPRGLRATLLLPCLTTATDRAVV